MICRHPYWFLGFLPLFLYFILALRHQSRLERLRRTIFFAPPRAGERRRILLFILTLALLLTALAEPVVYRRRAVFKRSGIDLTIGIDISKSMLAEDSAFPPSEPATGNRASRLNRARLLVLNLLDKLDGERIGIFVYAGSSYELVPPTTDYGYCRYLIENLDELALSAPGSRIAAGLETGIEMLNRKTEDSSEVILLIGDGEDAADTPDAFKIIIAKIRAADRRIYCVGIGRRTPGLIPIRTPDGREIIGYYKNEKGDFITTALEPERFKQLAAGSRGRYWTLEQERLASAIVKQIVLDLHNSGRSTTYEILPLSLSSWLLALAVVTFLLTL